MPFKFVDDGYPEADDYSSNYEWVEPVRAMRQPPRRMPCAMQYLRALAWGKNPWCKRERPPEDTPRRPAR